MARKLVKDAILEAAFELIENGDPLTVDAVIKRADVSKGGFFHHFKSKEILLTTMVAYCIRSIEDEIKELSAHESSDPVQRKVLRAYIRHSFSGGGARSRAGAVFVAIAAHHPELLGPVREFYRKRAATLQTMTSNPSVALAAILIADGLWVFDSLGIAPVAGEQREKVLDAVREWVNKSCSDL